MPGGPAESAGVRSGDIISAVNNTPTKGISLYEASELLQVRPTHTRTHTHTDRQTNREEKTHTHTHTQRERERGRDLHTNTLSRASVLKDVGTYMYR